MTTESSGMSDDTQDLKAKIAELEEQIRQTNRLMDDFAWATITWIHRLALQDVTLLQAAHMMNDGKNFRTDADLCKRLLDLGETYNDAKTAMEQNRPAAEGGLDA